MNRLQGKVAVITGGNAGIGEAIAKLFADEGASVVVTGRRKEELDRVVKGIGVNGGRALAVVGSVTDEAHVQDAVARYGFADQAHLCREFRRYHGENVSHFFKTARKNGRTMEENGVYPPEEVST